MADRCSICPVGIRRDMRADLGFQWSKRKCVVDDVISRGAQHRQFRSDFSSLLRCNSYRVVVDLWFYLAVRRFCTPWRSTLVARMVKRLTQKWEPDLVTQSASTISMAETRPLVHCTVLCS